MIDVRLPRKQNLDVLEMKTELFDACLDQWNRFLKSAIDQKMASRRRDQKRREIARADIVHIRDDAVCREGLVLRQRNFAELRLRQPERADQNQGQSHVHRSIIGPDAVPGALHGAIWSAGWRFR